MTSPASRRSSSARRLAAPQPLPWPRPRPREAADRTGGRPATRPALLFAAAGSAAVERSNQRVRARVQAFRVRVPDPDVHGGQVGVPEVELGPGLGIRLLARLGVLVSDEGAVLVVEGRRAECA